MNIRIVAVGKLKEKFWKAAVEEYAKRLGAYTKFEIVEVSDRDPAKCGGESKAMQFEATDILKAIPESAHVILLAIDGKQYSSESFAKHFESLMSSGISSFCFVIGGSTGVDSSVKMRANETFSFGKITLPHNLARVVLIEQLYRTFKIIKNEPYHK